jgi:predicted RNA-binding protein YlqC (UPF0109 family)
VRDLVLHLTRGLVREPGRVHVHERQVRDRTVYELSVAQADQGRVIGRQGRTATALRTLVAALGRRRGSPCELEILER